MHLIELDEAVGRICQKLEETAGGSQSPFFFMVGAGISHPPVPLAPEIIDHCKATAKRYMREKDSTSKETMDIDAEGGINAGQSHH